MYLRIVKGTTIISGVFLLSAIYFSALKRKITINWKQDRRIFNHLIHPPLLGAFTTYIDGLVRRYVPEEEQRDILKACHNSKYGGHFSGYRTATKVLQSGLY